MIGWQPWETATQSVQLSRAVLRTVVVSDRRLAKASASSRLRISIGFADCGSVGCFCT